MAVFYAWLRRHPMLVDGVLAVALAFAGVMPAIATGLLTTVPIGMGIVVPVVFRRKHPVGAFAAAVVIGGIQVALGVRPAAYDLAILVLLYTLAAYAPRRTSVWGLAVCLAGSAVGIVRWTSLGSHSVLSWLTIGAMLFAGPPCSPGSWATPCATAARTTRAWRTGPPGWNGSGTPRRGSPRWPSGPGSPGNCTT